MTELTDADIFGRSMYPDFREMLRPLLSRPISPQRWHALERRFLEELESRAKAFGTTPTEALRLAAVAAMRLANVEGRDLLPRQGPEWLQWYRRRIQALVTIDLLGTNGTRPTDEPLPSGAATPAEASGVLRRLEAVQVLDQLQEVATEAEAEVLDLMAEMIELGSPPQRARLEAARVTGRTPAAMRQMLRRLRRRHASRFSAE